MALTNYFDNDLSERDEIAHDYICAMLANPKFNHKTLKWIIKLAYEIADELIGRATK